MIIRQAEREDSNNISVVSHCVWADTYATEGLYTKLSKHILSGFSVPKIELLIDNSIILIAEENGKLFGYTEIDNKSKNGTEIKALYVLPKFQSTGVGSLLVTEIISKNTGVIWLSCWENNDTAINFYESMGFTEYGESYFELHGEYHRNILYKINT